MIRLEAAIPQFTVPDVVGRTGRAQGAYDAYFRMTGVEALAAELRARSADILEGPVSGRLSASAPAPRRRGSARRSPSH
jgi:hypothetical protein